MTNGNDLIQFSLDSSLANGLSKREYFAAMAMKSYLTPCNGWLSKNDLEEAAKRSTMAADALITALNTNP